MPRKIEPLALKQQPIAWGRSLVSGAVSALILMGFMDAFYLAGITPFSFELYLGSLIRGTQYGTQNWTVGFLATLFVGAFFGIFYGYYFEYVYRQSTPQIGIRVGIRHIVVAALIVFPFFNELHEFTGTGLYPHFGILASGLGAVTVILLMIAHLLYGASMGLFYGNVKLERARDRAFEPGRTAVPINQGGQSRDDDPEDAHTIIYRRG